MPLVAGEDLTPLQRVMIAADSGNGVAVVLDPGTYTFVNADLTVHLHRFPVDEWVCLESVTVPEPSGIGVSTSRLFDRRGPSASGCRASFSRRGRNAGHTSGARARDRRRCRDERGEVVALADDSPCRRRVPRARGLCLDGRSDHSPRPPPASPGGCSPGWTMSSG